eukprot:m51a1_g597 putative utp-glucose-1-phosphate uridylyltransferase (487) ;mRNA; f:62469-64335
MSASEEAVMSSRLGELSRTAPTDAARASFDRQMQGFMAMFRRYLATRSAGSECVDWSRIQPPTPGMVHHYSQLPRVSEPDVPGLLRRLVVAKLNGGLGTTMGCTSAKSHMLAHDGKSFLDITVEQVQHLNAVHGSDVPLVLMDSFNTHPQTLETVRNKYSKRGVRVFTFLQSKHPRFDAETLVPVARSIDSPDSEWYPPGHAEFYSGLRESGLLDLLLKENREYVFLSNADNLGALVDLKILASLVARKTEFAMEVTDKTLADIKGGTLIAYEGKAKLLELAQVPRDKIPEFESIEKFTIFNTNNLWFRLDAIGPMLDSGAMAAMDLIVNKKAALGTTVVQLEVAAGAAIQHFRTAVGINVPRSRFVPVKSTADLLLLRSNLYVIRDGALVANEARARASLPIVRLGEHFKKVEDFDRRFAAGVPDMLGLERLTISGDVTFGSGVTLRGSVRIEAPPGVRIDVPSGAVICDEVITDRRAIADRNTL